MNFKQRLQQNGTKTCKIKHNRVHSVPPVELQAFRPNLPSPHHLCLTYRPHYSSPTDTIIMIVKIQVNMSPPRSDEHSHHLQISPKMYTQKE